MIYAWYATWRGDIFLHRGLGGRHPNALEGTRVEPLRGIVDTV